MKNELQLSSAGLDWAVAHVGNYGHTRFFPYPFELPIIRNQTTAVKDYVRGLGKAIHRTPLALGAKHRASKRKDASKSNLCDRFTYKHLNSNSLSQQSVIG